MNQRSRRLIAWSAAPVVAAVLVAAFAAPSEAAPPGKKPPAAAPVKEPVTVASLASQLAPFKWGMTAADVVKVHNQVQGLFDQDFNPVLMRMQPGPAMKDKEAERENRKIAFERSLIKFERTLARLDSSGLRGEYSYMNKESLQSVEREGKKRYFFFIGDHPGARLWKICDEVPVGGALGNNLQEAAQKLAALLGTAGTSLPAAPERGLPMAFIGWQDATTQVRVMDRTSERVIGWCIEDRSILSALPQLRSHKEEDPLALDPSITAITAGGLTDPNAHKAQADAGAAPKKKH